MDAGNQPGDRDRQAVRVSQAVVLGVVQGPAELLPISSSAHINLVPWLCGWDSDHMDPELRKSFEVVLHAGAAAALLVGQRRLLVEELRGLDRRTGSILLLSFLPAAACGYLFERQIEERLGGPGAIAGGLVAGSIAMAAADRWPGRAARGEDARRRPWAGAARGGGLRWRLGRAAGRPGAMRRWGKRFARLRGVARTPASGESRTAARGRGRGEATAADGLALGVAQAAALAPGISRNGATLTAARLRGFSRDQANLLSRVVALPIITGATVLKGVRLARRGVGPEHSRVLAAGTAASFASTLASQRLIGLVERDRALWPYAVYRIALALTVLAKLTRSR